MKDDGAKRAVRPCDVSAIVLSYHSDFAKLRQTLLSLIFQEKVAVQIIVADDGSPENHRDRIVELFAQHGFANYKLVMNPENQGTIRNYISGLDAADGSYAKALSPGDFLSGGDVLRGWLKFMKDNGLDWSFSEIINYAMEDGKERVSSTVAMPVYVQPYLDGDTARARWNYVVLDDVAPGCAFMGRTDLMRRYACVLADAGNRYAEDYMFRMMMFDGVCGGYYPVATTFYEFGTGVSSGRSKAWAKVLFEEYRRMNRLLEEKKAPDAFQSRMLKYTRRKTSAFGMVFVPGKLRRVFRLRFRPRVFPVKLSDSEEWRAKCR